MAGSDVARIRQKIELEYVAAQRGLTGSAIASPHLYINQRLARIAQYHEELKKYVGEREAIEIVLEIQVNTVG